MNTTANIDVPESPEVARYRDALVNLPITNVPMACDVVEQLLSGMETKPPAPIDYLSMLEATREPVAFLLDTLATKFSAKPLPATDAEIQCFLRSTNLWRLMANSYARVAQTGAGVAAIQKQLALICQRCIYYTGQVILDHFRARREITQGLWLELHGYYDTADEWGIATEPVAESLEMGGETTCARTYSSLLLVGLANPYSRSQREFGWIIRWAHLAAADTCIVKPDSDEGGRGYGIDLMQDKGVLPVDHLAGTHSARLFNTVALGDKVKALFARMKGGESPTAVGLGNDCSAVNAMRLLLQLYRPWCLSAVPRRFERNRASGILSLSYGLESVYFHVTGDDFTQPQHTRVYSRMDADQLWTFRNQLDPTQPLHLRAAELGYALDNWDIADQSVNGFRVSRGNAGPRVEHGQLIAVKVSNSEQFHLGRFTWMVQLNNGQIEAGIQILPGPAKGVGVRPTGLSVSPNEPYTRGFFLPPVTALKEPLSVVIPHGWYHSGRVIEVYTDRPVLAKLDELIVRGPNFERCAFTLVNPGVPLRPAAPAGGR